MRVAGLFLRVEQLPDMEMQHIINGKYSAHDDCDLLCHGNQSWLFILGTGRSGSTTALEMVDAIPGFQLAGENNGIMNTLLDLYHSFQVTNAHGQGGAWSHGEISENRLLCRMQKFVKTMIGKFDEETTKVIGFKEIRHHKHDVLAFFKKVFPGARLLINTRKDLDEQHLSGTWHTSVEALENHTLELDLFQKQNPADTFKLLLEEYSKDLFNGMLRFLGVTGCSYAWVAHANNGNLSYGYESDLDSAAKAVIGECSIVPWKRVGCG